jgi:sensor histidine kinase YesM
MLSPLLVQLMTFGGDFVAFIGSRPHVRGYILVSIGAGVLGVLFALGGLYRERDAQIQAQALQFALEKETLERQAADARLHLLTAQIQPHFLLNTLANVQELVESGSPRAVPVFRSLIDYLRAAVPHLQQDERDAGGRDQAGARLSGPDAHAHAGPASLRDQVDPACWPCASRRWPC